MGLKVIRTVCLHPCEQTVNTNLYNAISRKIETREISDETVLKLQVEDYRGVYW